MYVIVVYDVGVERVDRVKRYLRMYLPHVQNSVFEGELSPARLARLKAGLTDLLELGTDSVLLWVLPNDHAVDRQIMGIERRPIGNFV